MRLKLSGPDYKDQDPLVALTDFKKRVALYEKKYIPLGEYEERNSMPYVQASALSLLADFRGINNSLTDDRCWS